MLGLSLVAVIWFLVGCIFGICLCRAAAHGDRMMESRRYPVVSVEEYFAEERP